MIILFLCCVEDIVELLYKKILHTLITHEIEFYFHSPNKIINETLLNSFEDIRKDKYQHNFITDIITIKEKNISHIFYQLCYNDYYSEKLKSNNIKKIYKNSKICYYNYGYSMVDHNFLNGVGENSDFFAECNYFFLENDLNTQHYSDRIIQSLKKSNISQDKINFKSIGCIKLDVFNNLNRINDSNEYFNIMWCPRWHTSGEFNLCSYNKCAKYFIKLIDDNKKIKLIFRPHPKTNYSIEELEDASKKNSRIIIDKSNNYFQYFKYIDVFISDPSSLLAEALYFNIPIIYTKNYDNVFTKFGNTIQDAFYHVTDINQLDDSIKNIINNKDHKKDIRLKYKKKFYDPYKNSCETLINLLKN